MAVPNDRTQPEVHQNQVGDHRAGRGSRSGDVVSADNELLELAAKAAGYKINFEESVNNWFPFGYDDHGCVVHWWNPLADDGDALRLAMVLRLAIRSDEGSVRVGWPGCIKWIGETCLPCDENARPHATRRAIVRAAAEIAKAHT